MGKSISKGIVCRGECCGDTVCPVTASLRVKAEQESQKQAKEFAAKIYLLVCLLSIAFNTPNLLDFLRTLGRCQRYSTLLLETRCKSTIWKLVYFEIGDSQRIMPRLYSLFTSIHLYPDRVFKEALSKGDNGIKINGVCVNTI